MRYPPLPTDAPEDLKSAVRRFESGFYHNAIDLLLKVLAATPSNTEAAHYLMLANRRLAPRSLSKPTLVWQFRPDGAWETDWLRELLGGVIGDEVVDNTWNRIVDPMIVVDNRLVPEKTSYYRDAFMRGCRVVLVHLSDEAFKDDLGAYRYCDAVIRNYYTERLADVASIRHIPLGFKAGFARPSSPDNPVSARRHVWSFAGDANKHGRADMLLNMDRVEGGRVHATSGFGAADALPTAEYRALIDDTAFAPCPGGWSNLDTFRVYEALEAGAIPIVERRPGFDYFTRLLGTHPIPAVEDWREAAAFVTAHRDPAVAEPLRRKCRAWWTDYKVRLRDDLAGFVRAALV